MCMYIFVSLFNSEVGEFSSFEREEKCMLTLSLARQNKDNYQIALHIIIVVS